MSLGTLSLFLSEQDKQGFEIRNPTKVAFKGNPNRKFHYEVRIRYTGIEMTYTIIIPRGGRFLPGGNATPLLYKRTASLRLGEVADLAKQRDS